MNESERENRDVAENTENEICQSYRDKGGEGRTEKENEQEG